MTSDFVSQQINATSLGLNSQITLFQGNQINNQIKRSKFLVDQYSLFEKEAKNDITLGITESYIQLLYAAKNGHSIHCGRVKLNHPGRAKVSHQKIDSI
ncbi:TolC family protein [Pricia sp. S334]|uniref:TolC family protein n=1 Tax=Pricia mediterranea TaxID=3076079 RepID=A0ABU3L3W3_9FLAO|nr:TolC family protein [Pricia sp. S334]MDT7828315.1 TolC family protein [Pricia sp. S334]